MSAMVRSLATDVARPPARCLLDTAGFIRLLHFTLLRDGDFEIFRHTGTARCTTIAVKLGVKNQSSPLRQTSPLSMLERVCGP